MERHSSVFSKSVCVVLALLSLILVPVSTYAATPATQQPVCWVIDAELVNSLCLPKNPEMLRKAYNKLLYRDVVLDMLYFMRLREMVHSEKDELDFLKSMPKNPTEFLFLYSVTSPENKKSFPKLGAAYQLYFEVLADLVIKHPEFLEQYFLQVYFSDGEIADRLETSTAKIQKAIPKQFNAVLKRLPAEVRARISAEY
jgi:hypothetical protein